MRIVYQDGSKIHGSYIEIADKHLYVDDIYTIHLDDVSHIEEDEEEKENDK